MAKTNNIKVGKSLEDLYVAIEKLNNKTGDTDGLTTEELADEWGVSTSVVTKKLRLLKKAGLLRMGTKRETRIDGKLFHAPCYSVAKKPKNSE